jgi:hypothetical protein
VTSILAHLITPRAIASELRVASRTALITWALMELGWGVNYFRRTLGFVVLGWSISSMLW